MPYQTAAQRHIEQLQAQLRARDHQDAMRIEAEQQAATKAKLDAAEADAKRILAEEMETTRAARWKLFRFAQNALNHPNDPIGDHISGIVAPPPADGTWPPGESPDDFRYDHQGAAAATIDDVAQTPLGRALAKRMAPLRAS